jgi:hypothetical protein
MELLFTPDDTGTIRGTGYATVPYSSDSEDETVVETTESDLSAVFEAAKENGASLDGAEKGIDAAIEDPLSYLDYLVLESGEIVFDDAYSRPTVQS